jgi:GNAT superfamily N-acetyltransferase
MPALSSPSALLPSFARLSLRTPTGSARGAGRSLAVAFDNEHHPRADIAPKAARRPSQKRCVGFIAVSRFYTTNDSGCVEGVLFIDEFFVDPDARRNKIGRCLLAYAMAQEDPRLTKRAALIVRATHPQQASARRLYAHAHFARASAVPDFQGIPKLRPKPGVEEYWEAPIGWRGCDELQEQDAQGRVYVGDTAFFVDSVRIPPELFLNTHAAIVKKANGHHARNRELPAEDGDGSRVQDVLGLVTLGVYAAYTCEQ